MRKVLFVLPDLDRGSMIRQVAALAQRLGARGRETRVCALRGGPGIDALHEVGIPTSILGRGWLCDPRPYQRLIRLVRSFAPDIVHCWQADKQPLIPSLVAWSSSARCITSIERSVTGVSSIIRRFFPVPKTGRTQWLLPSPSLTATSPDAAAMVVAPPALPGRSSGRSPSALRNELGIPPQARVILCAGRLLAPNGWRDALWALDILQFAEPRACLLLAGEGPDRADLESFVRANGIQDRVRFLGWRDDLADVVELAEVVWIPTLIDSVPLFMLESMAQGRPVVAARQPAIAAIIADNETGLLFPPGDKPALARQTRRLMQHPDLARHINAKAQTLVRKHFTAEAWIDRILAIYRETSDGPGAIGATARSLAA